MAITFRTTPDLDRKLAELAKRLHCSKNAVASQAVESLYTKMTAGNLDRSDKEGWLESDPFWSSLPVEQRLAITSTASACQPTLDYLRDH